MRLGGLVSRPTVTPGWNWDRSLGLWAYTWRIARNDLIHFESRIFSPMERQMFLEGARP